MDGLGKRSKKYYEGGNGPHMSMTPTQCTCPYCPLHVCHTSISLVTEQGDKATMPGWVVCRKIHISSQYTSSALVVQ